MKLPLLSDVDASHVVRSVRRSFLSRAGIALLCSLVAGLLVARSVAQLQQVERDFDIVDNVWVTTGPIDAGDIVTARSVSTKRLPAVALPDASRPVDPVGQRARRHLPKGSVMTDSDVGDVSTPTAAMLETHERAVYLTRQHVPPAVAVDDRIELWAATPSGSVLIAPFARVIGADSAGITVAVPLDLVEPLATAVAGDAVLVAISGA